MTPPDAKKKSFKEYSFILSRKGRDYQGQEPKDTAFDEEKILAKIEKRIQRMLEKSRTRSAAKLCTDTRLDGVRYVMHVGYGYKKEVIGKDRDTFGFILFTVTLVLLTVLSIWFIFGE